MRTRPDPKAEPPSTCWEPLGKTPSDLRILRELVAGPQTLAALKQATGMFAQSSKRAALWAKRHGLLETVPASETITASTVLQITAAGRARLERGAE